MCSSSQKLIRIVNKNTVRSAIFLGLAVGIVMVVVVAPFPDDSPLARELENAGHAPAFGALALVLLGLSRAVLKRRNLNHYRNALIGVLVLGIVSELLQLFSHRDAEVADVVRDFLGGVAFLGFYRTLDLSASRPAHRAWLRAAALLILFAVFSPAILWGMVIVHRNSAFPAILNFNSIWDARLCSTNNARMEMSPGKARIVFEPAEYSSFTIDEPYPDWKGYRFFCFEVYSDIPDTVHLVLRIHDKWHDHSYRDRFNQGLSVHAGRNEIRIPIEAIGSAPESRSMDLSAIRGVCLFAMRPVRSFSLEFSDFHCSK